MRGNVKAHEIEVGAVAYVYVQPAVVVHVGAGGAGG